MKDKGFIRIFAVCGVAVLLFFGFAEAFLRIRWGLGNPVLIEPDAACGYVLRPNQHLQRFGVNVWTNSLSMRSAEPAAVPVKLRALFVGDSIVYGSSQVDQSKIFTSLVGSELGWEVLNASAGAWAIGNEYEFVRSRGTFGSNLIVLVLNTGDLPQPFSRIGDVGDSLPSRAPFGAVDEVVERVLVPKLLHSGHRDAGTDLAHADPAVIARNLAYLADFKDLATRQGSRFAIAYIPFRKSIAANAKTSIPAQLETWAAANDVPVADLTRYVSTEPLASITLADRTHFNQLGNRYIASGLEAWLAGLHVPQATRLN